MAKIKFGPLQLRIMQLLWEEKHMNAKEITTALNENSDSKIAHSTVQTLLRQLEAKGAVSHEKKLRSFIFYPLVKEEKVTRNEIHNLIDRLFGGSRVGLMAYLLKKEKISKKEMKRIKALIEEKEGGN